MMRVRKYLTQEQSFFFFFFFSGDNKIYPNGYVVHLNFKLCFCLFISYVINYSANLRLPLKLCAKIVHYPLKYIRRIIT